jgi:hypothetical protein
MIRLAGNRLRNPLTRRLIPQSACHSVASSGTGGASVSSRNVPRIAFVGTRALSTVVGSTDDTTRRWAAGVAVLVAAGTVSGASALCEKVDDEKVDDKATTDDSTGLKADGVLDITVGTANEVEEEEEDPYANLPEEDEETSCSMCNTFRKGPCRPFWRKLERCFKDHEDEDNGAVKCMRYFKPHSDCLMDHTNLYHLISLDFKQEFVEDVQLSMTAEERKTWTPTVDWSNWIMFVKEAGISFQQTIPVEDKTTPLWQRVPEDTEPVLITITATVPKQQDESGLLLKAAYAVDQDGRVLGFTFSKDYGEKLQEAREAAAPPSDEKETASSDEKETSTSDEKETSTSDEKEPDDEEVSDPTVTPFEFFLLPGSTKEVRVCALYAEDPVAAPATKDILDACLMESTTISLVEVAEQAPSTTPNQSTTTSLANVFEKAPSTPPPN